MVTLAVAPMDRESRLKPLTVATGDELSDQPATRQRKDTATSRRIGRRIRRARRLHSFYVPVAPAALALLVVPAVVCCVVVWVRLALAEPCPTNSSRGSVGKLLGTHHQGKDGSDALCMIPAFVRLIDPCSRAHRSHGLLLLSAIGSTVMHLTPPPLVSIIMHTHTHTHTHMFTCILTCFSPHPLFPRSPLFPLICVFPAPARI